MKTSKLSCNFQQAQQLKALGLSQKNTLIAINPWNGRILGSSMLSRADIKQDEVSGLTGAELGEILPEHQTTRTGNRWNASIEYYHTPSGRGERMKASYNVTGAVSEAEARAGLLIYLLEKGVVKAADINDALKRQ